MDNGPQGARRACTASPCHLQTLISTIRLLCSTIAARPRVGLWLFLPVYGDCKRGHRVSELVGPCSEQGSELRRVMPGMTGTKAGVTQRPRESLSLPRPWRGGFEKCRNRFLNTQTPLMYEDPSLHVRTKAMTQPRGICLKEGRSCKQEVWRGRHETL